MARKTNFTVKTEDGKEYKYCRITRKVGKKQNKRGEWISEYKVFYGKTLQEAKDNYAAYMRHSSLSALKCLGEFMDWYIDNVFQADKSFTDGTKAIYINSYNLVFKDSDIIGRSLSEITGADLQSIISGSDRGASTIHQAVKLLRLFYKYVEAQHITTDITRGIVVPEIERKRKDQSIEIFTDDDLLKFRDATPKDHRLRLLVILAMNTGARVGELLALTYDDIKDNQVTINKSLVEIEKIHADPDSKTRAEISRTKTPASVRSIPANAQVLAALADHKAWHTAEMLKKGYRTNQIFTTETGALYYKSAVRTSFMRLCKTVGVEPKGFHTFRHTFGTKLAKGGIAIQTVSKLMGHTNINVTAKYYIHVETDEKRAAINTIAL